MNCVLFAKMDQVFSLKKNRTLEKYWKNGKKILEKSGKNQGILSVRKSGNPASPEIQKQGISGPTERTDVLQKI